MNSLQSFPTRAIAPDTLFLRITRCLARFRVMLPLGLLAAAILILATIEVGFAGPLAQHAPWLYSGLLIGAVILVMTTTWLIWHDFVKPFLHMRDWVLHMRGGNLGARMPEQGGEHVSNLLQDLNSLGEMLQSLAEDTERQLQRHTEYTAQKTRSLTILYDVAASINVSRDLDDLLTRFLHTLTEVVGARAAAVRLLTPDGQLRLVSSAGLDEDMVERERVIPSTTCLCGKSPSEMHKMQVEENLLPCAQRAGRSFFGQEDQELAMLAVPLQYRGKMLGIYNLFVNRHEFKQREDLQELFTSIGRHLGMAIDKARLDEEAQRLSIMEERTRLAYELHDSLAQTIASLRFQVRVLDETLHHEGGDGVMAWQELEKIESTVDEANTELRELIAQFRAPIDKRGLIPSVEQTVERFRQETGIHVFLQQEWAEGSLPMEHEIQILRIIQEALTNIRKHAQASTVRVLLRGDEDGHYRVLVEDDGIGIQDLAKPKSPGEQVGLGIMRDRARVIGGTLQIESEPGEGVQVLLRFRYPKDNIIPLRPMQRTTGGSIAGLDH